uniref:Uncharacterized protein n=1 Tax=Eutreptiella gymnastica TaxID=73025 RepID=A0A7S4CXU5_9EUGL
MHRHSYEVAKCGPGYAYPSSQTRLRDWAAASFAVAGTTLLSFLLLSVLSGLSPRSLTQLMISTSALHVRPAFALQPRGLGPRRTRAGAHMQLPGVGLSGAVEDAVQELEDRTRPLHEDTRDHDPAADLMSNVEDGAEAVPPPSGGDVKVQAMGPHAVMIGGLLGSTVFGAARWFRGRKGRRGDPKVYAKDSFRDSIQSSGASLWLAVLSIGTFIVAMALWKHPSVPNALTFLKPFLPLVLLAVLLWRFRAIHWLGAKSGMWLYQQRLSLILDRRPKRIILLRHGESMGNVNKAIYETVPDNRLKLSDKGHQQAADAGDKIKALVGIEKVGVFVSPFIRTQETAAGVLSKLDPQQVTFVRQDPRLREQEWGNFQSTRDSDKILQDREKVGRFFYRFQTGESGADVYDRVSSFLQSLFRRLDGPQTPPQNVLIVSHGLMMRFFLMRYFRWSVETFETVWNPDNCEFWVLEKCEKGIYTLSDQGTIPKSTKKVTVVFNDGHEEERVLGDYIRAPGKTRRRTDWILEKLGLDPAEVREIIIDPMTVCEVADHKSKLSAPSDNLFIRLLESDETGEADQVM